MSSTKSYPKESYPQERRNTTIGLPGTVDGRRFSGRSTESTDSSLNDSSLNVTILPMVYRLSLSPVSETMGQSFEYIERLDVQTHSEPDLYKAMRNQQEPQVAEFLAGQYPSSKYFKQEIRTNPELDLIIRRISSRKSAMSSSRSLKLTQVEENFYFSNVREILETIFVDEFKEDQDKTSVVIDIILKYLKSVKAVTFSMKDTRVLMVDPMGSDHRVLLPVTSNVIGRVKSLDKWERRPADTVEEKEKAKRIEATLDTRDFADAY